MNVLIAVPVFNEEKYVARVLADIRRYAPNLLAIDDGSTDATPSILRHMQAQNEIALLTHPENRGYGQSLIDAFKFAHAHHYDWVITMDCDEQHEPSRIPHFIEACQTNNPPGPLSADVISGSRYLLSETNADQPPPDRRSINRTITDLLNSTLDLRILPPINPDHNLSLPHADSNHAPILTDSFCGYKAHRVSAMHQILHDNALTIPGYAFPMQFWAQLAARQMKVRELPVRLIYKDATRHFGGTLDDPTARLKHYLEVLSQEIAATRRHAAQANFAPTNECAAICCDE